MSDIFISYKREDRPRVKPLVDALAAEGFSVWWDVGIEGGAAWRRSIQVELEAARCVVVVWSALSVGPEGEFVQDEAGVAKRRGVYLPVAIDDVVPPLGFGQVQSLPLIGWRGRRVDHRFRELAAAARRTADGAPSAGPAAKIPRSARWSRLPRLWPIGAAVLGVLIVAAAAWFAFDRLAPSPPPTRMAILPFDVAAGDPVAQSLADGVVEGLTGALDADRIETTSAEAAARLHGPDRARTARALGVAYVLGGQARRTGDAFHVTVHLDDPAVETRLWSFGFDRPVSQVLGFQEEVANSVETALDCVYSARKQKDVRLDRPTIAAFMQACATQDANRARDLFKKLIDRAPRLSAARSTLALADVIAAGGLPAPQDQAARAEARAMALSALALNPNDGRGYAALAILTPWENWTEREKLLLAGLSVDPDEGFLNMPQARLLQGVGRNHEAALYAQHGSLLTPLDDGLSGIAAKILAQDGRFAQAKAAIERAAQIWPGSDNVRSDRFRINLFAGDPERALALLKEPATRPSDMEADELAAWQAVAEALKSKAPSAIHAAGLAMSTAGANGKVDVTDAVRSLAALGLVDDAFRLLEHPPRGSQIWPGHLFTREAADLRRDPRFMPVAATLGLVDFWRSTGKWPDFCEAPDRPYDCRAAAARLVGAR